MYISTLIILLICASTSYAQWGHTEHDYLRLHGWLDIHSCPDGAGGVWVATKIAGNRVGVEHVNQEGFIAEWEVMDALATKNCWGPVVTQADNGDLIMVVREIAEDDHYYATFQRINKHGERLWGDDGKRLRDEYTTVNEIYNGPVPGTYLFDWGNIVLINDDGNVVQKLANVNEVGSGKSFKINSSDSCVIAGVQLNREAFKFYKIRYDGERPWGQEPIIFDRAGTRTSLHDGISDNQGGLIFVWEFYNYEDDQDTIRYRGVEAARISCEGELVWRRIIYEREWVIYETFPDIDPFLNYAGSSRFFIAWTDYDDAFQVTCLNSDGDLLWDVPTDMILGGGGYSKLDGIGSQNSVCYIWRDTDHYRAGDNEDVVQVFGQRISTEGDRLWGRRGTAVLAKVMTNRSNISNGSGGVISTVSPGASVQMINMNGDLGTVLGVHDGENTDKLILHKLTPRIKVYPNPSNSHFKIEFDSKYPHEVISYTIYNLMGRTVLSGMMMEAPYMIQDLSKFSSGEYILMLQSQLSTVSTRFLLIK